MNWPGARDISALESWKDIGFIHICLLLTFVALGGSPSFCSGRVPSNVIAIMSADLLRSKTSNVGDTASYCGDARHAPCSDVRHSGC